MKKTFYFLSHLNHFILSGCSGKTKQIRLKRPKNKILLPFRRKKRSKTYHIRYIGLQPKIAKLWQMGTPRVDGLFKVNPIPLDGAILPFKRIVAYYGNLYSKRMGVLGEYPPCRTMAKLNTEIKAWEAMTQPLPIPAIHYIAVVAQGNPSKNGKYRTRMPDCQIDSALSIAKMGNAIVF